jgi:2-(1,2-epoxy-1,2-dihydrophenyl)acetyl-CoA isomerase
LDTILVERDAGVVTVTLNRPQRRNAINLEMARELLALVDEVAASPEDRVVLITGAGEMFCSGGDLSQSGDPIGPLNGMRLVTAPAVRLHQLHKPTIAAVNGAAIGAGCNLALGCDLTVAAEDARFSEIFIRRGFSMDYGGTWLLPRLVGLQKAKELAFFGRDLNAKEAAEMGLILRAVPATRLLEEAHELARSLAAQPPAALSITKAALNRAMSTSFADAIEIEAVSQIVAAMSPEAQEAMQRFRSRAKEQP